MTIVKRRRWGLTAEYWCGYAASIAKLKCPYHHTMQFKETLHQGFDSDGRCHRTRKQWAYRT